MFWRKKENQNTPAVKKVSELINSKSHVQKKYISLMLVPSYSTGKTRSLRIPRAVLHGLAISIFIVFSVFMGLYLRSIHFENAARDLGNLLEDTEEEFYLFQQEAEEVQQYLQDAAAEIYGRYTVEQRRAQLEIDRADRRHQQNLEDIWDLIEALEDQVIETDERIQEITSNLGARRIINNIVTHINQMEATQEYLRETLMPVWEPPAGDSAVGLMGGVVQIAALNEDELMSRLNYLLDTIAFQNMLLDSINYYRDKMYPYLLNFPTLRPIQGNISSPFGRRPNPFGSGFETHTGIDIPAPTGTHIRAAGGGTVTISGWMSGYGNVVVIYHGSGMHTLYAHNNRNIVSVGERVERGQVIAHVGSTGRSTAPHLHYEVRLNGTRYSMGAPVDPVRFITENHQLNS